MATFLDETVQQDVQDLASYVANKQLEKVIPLLEKLKQNRSNREMDLYLEEVAQEYLVKHLYTRAVNMNKLGKELEVFFSMLLMYSADNPEILEFDLKKE